MSVVYLSLGSNIDRERNIRSGIAALRDYFPSLKLSPVYESEAVGFEGSAFYNLVAKIETTMSPGELTDRLRQIEADHGRVRTGKKFSSRTLDIDVLTYGDYTGTHEGVDLPRDEILRFAFVLKPLADLAPDEIHPVVEKTYSELMRASDFTDQVLWVVDFDWHS